MVRNKFWDMLKFPYFAKCLYRVDSYNVALALVDSSRGLGSSGGSVQVNIRPFLI